MINGPSEGETSSIHATSRRKKRGLLYVILALLVLGVLTVGGFALLRQQDVSPQIPNQLVAAQDSMGFDVYYPVPLPPEFELDETSISAVDFVSFSLLTNGSTLYITEQARPPIMEQVTKTSEFDTAIGPAYIADLAGRTTGFILTPKTLVIITSKDKINTEKLEQLMQSMQLI